MPWRCLGSSLLRYAYTITAQNSTSPGLIQRGVVSGIGVRELVLLFLLKGEVSEANLVFAVLLGRMVTVGGDIMIYITAMIMNSDNRERIVHD